MLRWPIFFNTTIVCRQGQLETIFFNSTIVCRQGQMETIFFNSTTVFRQGQLETKLGVQRYFINDGELQVLVISFDSVHNFGIPCIWDIANICLRVILPFVASISKYLHAIVINTGAYLRAIMLCYLFLKRNWFV